LAAALVSPGQVETMRNLGQFKNAHLVTDLYGKVQMPYNGFVMTEKVLYGDPVLAKKIVRAIVKGARYTKAFKREAIAMSEHYMKTAIDQHGDETDYDEFVKGLTPDWTVGNDVIASDLNIRAALINLPKDQIPPIAKIYDFSFVRAVNAELDASRWKPTR
jgi:ABC-type nitrate/sulfonate/bicarbonate transport system substrate-binding protein